MVLGKHNWALQVISPTDKPSRQPVCCCCCFLLVKTWQPKPAPKPSQFVRPILDMFKQGSQGIQKHDSWDWQSVFRCVQSHGRLDQLAWFSVHFPDASFNIPAWSGPNWIEPQLPNPPESRPRTDICVALVGLLGLISPGHEASGAFFHVQQLGRSCTWLQGHHGTSTFLGEEDQPATGLWMMMANDDGEWWLMMGRDG